jgi:hypothetical protein
MSCIHKIISATLFYIRKIYQQHFKSYQLLATYSIIKIKNLSIIVFLKGKKFRYSKERVLGHSRDISHCKRHYSLGYQKE